MSLKFSQPEFYHFSRDSIELAHFAARLFDHKESVSLLDICAGCGVVGLEFAQNFKGKFYVDFIERQPEFRHCLQKNINLLNKKIDSRVMIDNFENIRTAIKYDLILCNPPFYIEGTVRLPYVNEKRICHVWNEISFFNLLQFMKSALKSKGEAYFLGRKNLSYLRKAVEQGVIIEKKFLQKSVIYKLA